MRALISVFLLCLGVASVQAGDPFGVPVQIGVGGSVQFGEGELTVGFDGVLSDSRCPEGVWCFWPGDAEPDLWLQPADGPRVDFVLHTYYNWDDPFQSGPFTVYLDRVEPYPVYGEEIDPDDYVVTLTVWSGAVPDRVRPWAGVKALYR